MTSADDITWIKAVIDYGNLTEEYASLTQLNERLGLIRRLTDGLEVVIDNSGGAPDDSIREDKEYVDRNRITYQSAIPAFLNKASTLSRMIDEYRKSAPKPVVEAIDGRLAQIQDYCNDLFKVTGVNLQGR